jgi:hypothetical protein
MNMEKAVLQAKSLPASLDSLSSDEVDAFKVWAGAKKPSTKGAPVIAKGDSWFDFLPGTDVIDCLRALHNWPVTNFSKAGDTLENMIHGNQTDGDGQLLSPGLAKALVAVKQTQPKAFLFSGGGNDIAGDELINYLNHGKVGANDVLREQIVKFMIHEVFAGYLQHMINEVARVSERTVVVMHGYGHAYPSGKGVGFLIFNFAGPWLKPSLDRKGISSALGQSAIHRLIDEYNEMLKKLADRNKNFFYVDLRDMISEADWRDELHLKNSAYARVAGAINSVLESDLGRSSKIRPK